VSPGSDAHPRIESIEVHHYRLPLDPTFIEYPFDPP
jgi:hypothetical protein